MGAGAGHMALRHPHSRHERRQAPLDPVGHTISRLSCPSTTPERTQHSRATILALKWPDKVGVCGPPVPGRRTGGSRTSALGHTRASAPGCGIHCHQIGIGSGDPNSGRKPLSRSGWHPLRTIPNAAGSPTSPAHSLSETRAACVYPPCKARWSERTRYAVICDLDSPDETLVRKD